MIDQATLHKLLTYNPNSGVFTWKPRKGNKRWNTKYANKEAGCECTPMPGYSSYRVINISKTVYFTHRLAILYIDGYFPIQIDHQDGNGLNNIYSNLKSGTALSNSKNTRRYTNNKSGIMGVAMRQKRWQTSITVNKHLIALGRFRDFFEACCARKSAENRYNYHPNHGKR